MVDRVLGFEEALAEVLRQAATLAMPRGAERVTLSEAAGRV